MAAVDYFLKIDGISGESTDEKHKGEIEVESFSWGVSDTSSTTAGGGGGAGRAAFSDFSFAALTSKASPVLFQRCASGQHIKEAVLTGRKAGGTQDPFLVITLKDLLLSSYQISGGGGAPNDSASLHYGQIVEVVGTAQHLGIAPAASATLTYDVKTRTVRVVENTSGLFAVGGTDGSITRAVEEFDITDVLGLITRPHSTAKLRLLVNEVRGASAAASSVPDGAEDRGHAARFDVLLYTPADLALTAEDLTRSGRRVGRLWVDPAGDPASLSTDLSRVFQRGSLTSFGIRLQLHDARITALHEAPDDQDEPSVHMDASNEDQRKSTRAQASATFSIQLVLDTA